MRASIAGFALVATEVRLADLERGADGLRVRGGGEQEPPERGDAEVELGIVGRPGDAVGLRDLIERLGAELLGLLRGVLEAAEVPGQVGPGHPGGDVLTGGKLGLAQVEPRGEAVGSVGVLVEIGLEVADRVADGAGLGLLGLRRVRVDWSGGLGGPGHREQERGAEGLPLGQLAGLGEQDVRPGRVGLRDGVIGREQAAGEGVVDLGEPVLATRGQERLGLEPGQGLGLRRLPVGQLDGGQLEPDLRSPGAFRLELQGLGQGRPSLVRLPAQPLGDPSEEPVIRLVRRSLRPGDQAVERGRRLGVFRLLHRGDHRAGQLRGDRRDGPGRGGLRRLRIVRARLTHAPSSKNAAHRPRVRPSC